MQFVYSVEMEDQFVTNAQFFMITDKARSSVETTNYKVFRTILLNLVMIF